jgi:hypothetical protein
MLAEGWIVRGLHDTARALPADLAVEVRVGDRNDDDSPAGLLADGADGVVDTIAYTSQHAHQLLDVFGAVAAALLDKAGVLSSRRRVNESQSSGGRQRSRFTSYATIVRPTLLS